MSTTLPPPSATGQLVFSPADVSLGIGVVIGHDATRIRVQFLRQENERLYTKRGAAGVLARYQVTAGENIRDADGKECLVVGIEEGSGDDRGLWVYQLEDGRKLLESVVVPEMRDVGAKTRLATLNLVHPKLVRTRMQGVALRRTFERPGLAAVLGARVQWLPHQIDVASRAISTDPVRMLLADEVGLGKTVEAALIYAGLRHEQRADRVLILTPKALTIQWLGEIFRKSHELLVLLDRSRLEDSAQDFPDLSPFEAHQRIIMDLDSLVGSPRLTQQAMDADWDVVIVDEAHHLKWKAQDGGNAGYKLVEGLAQQSRHLLLLTATPMALDPAEYHALLRLLAPERFDDPSAFASVHTHVKNIREIARALDEAAKNRKALSKRNAKALVAALSDDVVDAEYAAEFLKIKPTAKKREEAARTLLEQLRARHGIADYVVRNRRGPVGGLPNRKPEVFAIEATEQQDQLIDLGESVMLEIVKGITDDAERYRTLGTLMRTLWATPRALLDILQPLSPDLALELAPYVSTVVSAPLDDNGLPTGDARLCWLIRLLRQLKPGEKVLVFVQTDIAVRALVDALDTLMTGDVAVFHRGLGPRDQDRQVAWFRDPNGPAVMLSTEAGGEGRNFQFCHTVVLYDMPWRPATVEQRIGRIDRVGQTEDVRVLVPYFKGGFEAAVLKVMHESIGVLDQTVGGIDHALEYVSDSLAELIYTGAAPEQWKALFLNVRKLVTETRERIEAAVDPILDHASFDAARVQRLLDNLPKDLDPRIERFVRGYAEHNRLDIHDKLDTLVGIEGAPGAAGGADGDSAYVATFNRMHALDHEDVEFLSFGHPLVDQALDWADEASHASAGLAICRGFPRDGAAFVWRFELSIPSDVPQAAAYFDTHLFTCALGEDGKPIDALCDILDNDDQQLERMDPSPLKAAGPRWASLVEQNFSSAEKLNLGSIAQARERAHLAMRVNFEKRHRDLERQFNREHARYTRSGDEEASEDHRAIYEVRVSQLDNEQERVERAINNTRGRLLGALALRLVKTSLVSG